MYINFCFILYRYIGIYKGKITPIDPEGSALPTGYLFRRGLKEQPQIGEDVPTKLFSLIADDINALLSR